MNLPDALRLARSTAGLTQAQLADALGMQRRSVWAWETGASPPCSEHVALLARVLRITIAVDRSGAWSVQQPRPRENSLEVSEPVRRVRAQR